MTKRCGGSGNAPDVDECVLCDKINGKKGIAWKWQSENEWEIDGIDASNTAKLSSITWMFRMVYEKQ